MKWSCSRESVIEPLAVGKRKAVRDKWLGWIFQDISYSGASDKHGVFGMFPE